MAMTGTTIFSHILPIIFGFFGVLMMISGMLDDKKTNLIIGIVLFIFGCVSPFIIVSAML